VGRRPLGRCFLLAFPPSHRPVLTPAHQLPLPAPSTPPPPPSHRFQSELPGARRFTRVFPSLATIAREEGPTALYRG
jgi:hypothetical protein